MGGASRIDDMAIDGGTDGAATVRFSVRGAIRDAFNEAGWAEAYDAHDNTFKLKYAVRLYAGSGRKRTLGEVDSYRKASIFWTRNPKLVNPVKDRRIWVQVAKNFEPFIPLTVEGVQSELFDFAERISFDPAELGGGGELGAEVRVSWQRHKYAEPESHKASVTARAASD